MGIKGGVKCELHVPKAGLWPKHQTWLRLLQERWGGEGEWRVTERTRRGVLTDDGRAGELEALLFLFPVYLACVVRNKTYRTHPTQTRKGAVWNSPNTNTEGGSLELTQHKHGRGQFGTHPTQTRKGAVGTKCPLQHC